MIIVIFIDLVILFVFYLITRWLIRKDNLSHGHLLSIASSLLVFTLIGFLVALLLWSHTDCKPNRLINFKGCGLDNFLGSTVIWPLQLLMLF